MAPLLADGLELPSLPTTADAAAAAAMAPVSNTLVLFMAALLAFVIVLWFLSLWNRDRLHAGERRAKDEQVQAMYLQTMQQYIDLTKERANDDREQTKAITQLVEGHRADTERVLQAVEAVLSVPDPPRAPESARNRAPRTGSNE